MIYLNHFTVEKIKILFLQHKDKNDVLIWMFANNISVIYSIFPPDIVYTLNISVVISVKIYDLWRTCINIGYKTLANLQNCLVSTSTLICLPTRDSESLYWVILWPQWYFLNWQLCSCISLQFPNQRNATAALFWTQKHLTGFLTNLTLCW